MADGVTLNPGTGGAVVDTEQPATRGLQIQRVKLVLGTIDVDGGDVASGNPVPVAISGTPTVSDSQSLPFQGAVAMTVGTSQATQRSIGVNCTVAGSMTITLADASTISLPLSVGWQTFPFAVSKVNSSTATATYFNLK